MKRPDWWPQSSKPAPEPGKDTPDTWEHSVEVEVPFLQKVLTNFSILPVVFGNVDPAQVAQAVADATRRQNPDRGEFGFEPLPSL